MINIPVSDLAITIPNFSFIRTNKSKTSKISFKIEIQLNDQVYHSNKRFKDFDRLHENLRKNAFQVPDLPNKHLLSRSSKNIENRRQALEIYLKRLINTFDMFLPIEMVEFLNLNDLQNNCHQSYYDEFNDESFSIPFIGVQDGNYKEKFSEKNDIVLEGILKHYYN